MSAAQALQLSSYSPTHGQSEATRTHPLPAFTPTQSYSEHSYKQLHAQEFQQITSVMHTFLLFASSIFGALYTYSKSRCISAGLGGMAVLALCSLWKKTQIPLKVQHIRPTKTLDNIVQTINKTKLLDVSLSIFSIRDQIQQVSDLCKQIDVCLHQDPIPRLSLNEYLQTCIDVSFSLEESCQTLQTNVTSLSQIHRDWERCLKNPQRLYAVLSLHVEQDTNHNFELTKCTYFEKMLTVICNLSKEEKQWSQLLQPLCSQLTTIIAYIDAQKALTQQTSLAYPLPAVAAQLLTRYKHIEDLLADIQNRLVDTRSPVQLL